jgi:[1-hydroxy-2-(trimethylamino)ethyl]phosphonate dioxygenase
MNIVDEIERLFAEGGAAAYFGEPVSQTEHALQTAYLAQQTGAADSLVVAALLHDIGHLLHGLDEKIANRGLDGRHEGAGAVWLSRYFEPDVTDPIRLHVDAKRYLCAVDHSYRDQLSPASLQSLRLQGGPFTSNEVEAFEQERYFREAVALRRWDDAAKIPGLEVPAMGTYRERVRSVLARQST